MIQKQAEAKNDEQRAVEDEKKKVCPVIQEVSTRCPYTVTFCDHIMCVYFSLINFSA